jgi:phosphoglycolate phosphatase
VPIESAASSKLRLAVLDMGGTTIDERGLQETAFTRAVAEQGVDPESARFRTMFAYARETMGTSKLSVFEQLFDGDLEVAARTNKVFELFYDELLAEHGVQPIPGAEEAITRLREAGLKICLSTGFARHTQNMILESLGWMGLADLSLCPSDAGRGRPYPDMILTAVLALDLDDVRSVLVAGDTTSDMLAGLRAGASVVAGVLTGYHDEAALRAAGATAVVPSIRELPELL